MFIDGSESRAERHSLGFSNPNLTAGYSLAISYSLFILIKSKAKSFIFITTLSITIYLITGSRTVFCTIIFLLISRHFFEMKSKPLRCFAITLIPIIALFNILFLYQFSFGPLESELDKLSSYRFSYIYRLIPNIPITPFGDASIFKAAFDKDLDALDNSYIHLLLHYGFIGATVFILSIFFGALKHIDDVKLLSLCSAVCFAGLLEAWIVNPIIAFPLLKIIVDGADIRLPRSRPA